jgi:tetratricopeptide (TPR) repeat protein
VAAVSQETFEQAYREIGRLLRIPGIADAKADVKQLVKARLSDEGSGQWLVIVDNADDDNILFGPLQEGGGTDRLVDYLPHSRKGSMVFTTRTRKVAVRLAGKNHIRLNELDEAEARKMLEQHVPNKSLLEDDEAVHEFLELLTYLPLAIIQAVAFVVGNNTRLSEYMAIYKESDRDATDLLSRDFEDQGRYWQIQNPVAMTWYISFSKIQEQDTLAAEYLSLMACTTGKAVPASLLWPGSTKLATIEALGTLSAYAFIAEREQRPSSLGALRQERTFDMHRLVRLVTRNWLKMNGRWQEWASKALTRLVEIVPFGDYETRETWTAYLPHAMHVVDVPEVSETEGSISLLERVGRCEQTLGRYRAAEQANGQVLERREQVLGKEHPHTLASMNDVAYALSGQGKYAEAELMYRETLSLKEKVLGKEHPDTLTSINNLAMALSHQGKYAEAEAMHRETLLLEEKVLGKEHPDMLTSINNLAMALSRQGKYAEAEAMHRETLLLEEKVLGKEHPDTLTSINNLAIALSDQGKYAEAEAMHRETLSLKEKVLGKEHPDMLTSINNLALALSRQGKYAEAEAMHRETLLLREKVLGKEHPDSLTSMNNLAVALSRQGKYAEAEAMHREESAVREKVSGKEHADTLKSINSLAMALSGQGKYVEAEAMYRNTLALIDKVLGKEHPHTLNCMYGLARLLEFQDQYQEALLLYERAYTGYQNTLGPDHPTTRFCFNHYTSAQRSADSFLSANRRHDPINTISESVRSAHAGSSTADLDFEAVSRKRRRLDEQILR